jgi:delta 1-pyrroline-5-carboxylate dehydrogenase
VTRDILVDGIPVSVTDTVEGVAAFGGAAFEGAAGVEGGPRVMLQMVEDDASAAATDADVEAAVEAAVAAALQAAAAEGGDGEEEEQQEAEAVSN